MNNLIQIIYLKAGIGIQKSGEHTVIELVASFCIVMQEMDRSLELSIFLTVVSGTYDRSPEWELLKTSPEVPFDMSTQ